ncbi:cytochrome P450 [Leptodontidium sp. MPI-SDFR-AT-0119]|nr:cytochrome P450 [Leptodontidium sp. MPI-SDFR-AT-0119]
MGFVRQGKDVNGFISNIHGAFYWVANLPGQSSWISHLITTFLAPLFKLRIANYVQPFQKLSVDKIFSRMKESSRESKKHDMLDHFLAMKDPEGKPAFISAIMAEIGNVLAAGADTIFVAMTAVLGPLLRDSVRYRRLQAELDGAMNDRGLANEPVKDVPFLKACVKEGSRFHPNADEWKPERWIPGEGSSEEDIKLMDKHLATYCYGSRTCIGRNLATFEVSKFVGKFLTRCDVEFIGPKCPWIVKSLWLTELGNMMIRLKKRRYD